MTGTVIKSNHSETLNGGVGSHLYSRSQRCRWTLTRVPLIGAFTLTLGVLFTYAQGQSLRTYISGTGNDSNACSETSPCLTLQGALAKTVAGGQIYALSSANYGYVTIDKAVSIISGRGATGVLAASSVSGITINAGANDIISLQGLDIDGAGSGANGILFSSGASLTVKDSTIRGFATGISFQPTAASALSVAGTLISNNTTGIAFQSTTSSTGVLSDIQVVNNTTGVTVLGASSTGQAIVTAQGCIVANNSGVGVQASSYSAVTVTDCTVANNGVGLAAQSVSALLQTSGSTVTGNGTGWQVTNSGQVISATNNSIGGNTAGNAAPPTSPVPPTPIYIAKNIVTDFGATCNGVANDAPAFAAFNTWAQAQTLQVQLTIPSGSICWFGTNVGRWWAKGIKNLLVLGDGATITSLNGIGFQLGGLGVCQKGLNDANGCSARTETVLAGSTSLKLLNTSYSSRFVVGQYALMTGLDIQGLWLAPYGFPPNLHFFEYVKITSVNAQTGEVTFETPLKNTYKSTWPNYNSGNAFEADAGGPATLYALDRSWDTQVEYRGLTISQVGQTYANGRSVTYRNVTFSGANGGIPTQNLVWQAVNTSFADVIMEVDKLIGTIVMDGVTIKQIKFQSSSTDLLTMSNSSVTGTLDGTPKKAVISNSTLASFRPGAYAYGSSNEVVCTNCIISSLGALGLTQSITSMSMSAGVISFPNTAATGYAPAQAWAVPGSNIFWRGAYETQGVFNIIDVTQDATNTYVRTNLNSGLPSLPGQLSLRTHPAPKFTCTNCSGSTDAIDLAQAPPGAPLYSYSKRSYSPTSAQGSLGSQKIWGHLVSLKINVTQPYVGSEIVTLKPAGQFHNFTVKSDGTVFDYTPAINLKTAGERVITPSGVTCNGVAGPCSGDANLTMPEAVWLVNSLGPYMGSAFAGSPPVVSIEIQTDQSAGP